MVTSRRLGRTSRGISCAADAMPAGSLVACCTGWVSATFAAEANGSDQAGEACASVSLVRAVGPEPVWIVDAD